VFFIVDSPVRGIFIIVAHAQAQAFCVYASADALAHRLEDLIQPVS
jgi:hypothetical protein